jgi:hypothetical protein
MAGHVFAGYAAGDVVAAMTYDAFSEVGLLPAAQALSVPSVDPRVVALLTSGLTASIGEHWARKQASSTGLKYRHESTFASS